MKKLKVRRGIFKRASIHFKKTPATISNWWKKDKIELLEWILEQETSNTKKIESLKLKIDKVSDAKN